MSRESNYPAECTPILLSQPGVRIFRQTLSSVIASLGSFTAGSMLGWSSPANDDLRSRSSLGTLNDNDFLWLSTLCMIGFILGSLAVGFRVEKYGKRLLMLILCVPCFIGWLMMALASSLLWLASGRLITGFCGGAFCVIAPLYISEIAHDSIRGRLAILGNTMLSIGIVYSYAIGSLVPWEWMSAACGVIPIFLFFGTWLYLRETPNHLIRKQKIEEAYQVLRWLHGPNTSEISIDARLNEISFPVEYDLERGSWANFFQPYSWKPVLISLTMFACQQLCGINAIIFYSTEIFTLAGKGMGSSLAAILVAFTFHTSNFCRTFFLCD